MSGTFTVGETKIRPGVYTRYENAGGVELAGASNGIGAAIIRANWGPLNQVKWIENPVTAASIFGESGTNHTVNIVNEMLTGGASKVAVVRAGTGGTAATITLKDTAGTAANAVTITAKFVGARSISVTIKDSLSDVTKRECIIYSGTMEFEKVTFAKGSTGNGEPAALVAALASSDNFTASKVADGNKTLAAVTSTAFTAGADPTATTTEYTAALNVLEAAKWNVLIVDTNDTAIHALVAAFVDRIYAAGSNCMAVISEPKTVALATRVADCAAFNDEKIVYVLNSAYDASSNLYDGYLAAARIGGMVAAIPSNQSLTHTVVSGMVTIAEALTNTEIEDALQKGCLVLTVNTAGQIWIEQGINTLVTPAGNQDAGWKKIRRTKTRFELIDRVTATTDPLIGKVDNDSDGRATIIAAANGIIKKMIAEKKLLDGSCIEDPSNPAAGDSAWFILAVDDVDSIERVYLTFRFRFNAVA
ncbi:MAG: phage tail sheath subtilisin-like domain-containing protein [Bacteroides sp.]